MRSKKKSDAFWYDKTAGDRAVAWFSKHLCLTTGEWAGKPFVPSPWQSDDILRPLFGWKRKSDGTRRYRVAWIEIPKKNTKSTMCAAFGLYLLIGDGEPRAQVFSAACDREQAKIVFDNAKEMALASPSLRKYLTIHRNNISVPKTGSFMRPISSEANNQDGIDAHGVIIDEIHRHKTRELWDVLEYSGSSRRQPLIVVITTAGTYDDPESIYIELHEYAKRIQADPEIDPTWFVYIKDADDKKDDWEDREVWKRTNPELGHAKKWEAMETAYARAKEGGPTAQINFKRLHLNMLTRSASRWMDKERWERCKRKYKESDLLGRRCYAGLDLSKTTDLTALALAFPPEEEKEPWKSLVYYWLPEDNIQKLKKVDRVPYDAYRKAGWIEATPGDIVDYRFIVQRIKDAGEKFDIEEIAFDKWNATQTALELADHGFGMVEFQQTFMGFNEAMKVFEREVYKRRIAHNNNPVLTWNLMNVVARIDPSGNIRPDKEKGSNKIDGAVALIMALGRGMIHAEETEDNSPVGFAML